MANEKISELELSTDLKNASVPFIRDGGNYRAPAWIFGFTPYDLQRDYGATADGRTAAEGGTDQAAWEAARVDFEIAGKSGFFYLGSHGHYMLDGARQDTGRGNAQFLLPSRHVLNDQQISFGLVGSGMAPPIFSVVGSQPLPETHVIVESTLDAGGDVGGAMIGGWGPSGSYLDYTFVHFFTSGVNYRCPVNPKITALDLSRVCSVDIDGTVIDASEWAVTDMVEPTTATSFGVKLPGLANGAHTRIGSLTIGGFYYGFRSSEHLNAFQLDIFGCKYVGQLQGADHASYITRLQQIHCTYGLEFLGPHYLQVAQMNIERAPSGDGWTETIDDFHDPANYAKGEVTWHAVLGYVGTVHTFTADGGSGVRFRELGNNSGGGAAEPITAAASDEFTPITAGTDKVTFRNVGAKTITGVRASLTTAQTSGSIFTVDINVNGSSILSTKLTIDNGEATSVTAATPAVIGSSALGDNDVVSIDVDSIGSGNATGLKVSLLFS